MTPIADFVLVEYTVETKVGRILLPETAQKKSTTAKVLAVGPGNWIPALDRRLSVSELVGVDIKPGTTVVTSPYTGMEVEGKVHQRLVRSSDILAVLA